jgi:hypothetical protein
VKTTGFDVNANYGEYATANLIQLGDFIISVNFRQLSLTLVFALAVSAYAAFRHNRGIQAGALFLTAVTTLQWWSFIIFSGRFLHQYHNDEAAAADALINSGLPFITPSAGWVQLDAQRAMYAGACIILAVETIRTFILLSRYFSYVPITRNNIIPTYIRGAFATANIIPVLLFWFEVAVTIAWWVLQFVSESDTGIFNAVPGWVSGGPVTPTSVASVPFYVPLQNVVTETLFIWQTMYLLAVFLPELFSERTKTLASKQAALAVNIVIISAYFLLSWPWAWAGSYKSGYWEQGQDYAGQAQVVGFCQLTRDNQGHDNCYLMQGAAILSFIGGLGFVLLAIWQLLRILSILPTSGQVATIDGTVVDALPPTVGIQKALGFSSALLLVGLLIWALAAIDAGSGYNGWEAWTFGQLPSSPGWQALLAVNVFNNGDNPWQTLLSYTYSIAFGDLVIMGFAVWTASEMAANPVVANWHSWRSLVTSLSAVLFTFFLPQFIQICRYVNWGGLGAIGNAIASGFIIMCVGEFALYVCALSAQRAPLIALPAAISNATAPVQQQPGYAKPANLENVVVDTTKPGNPPVTTAETATGYQAGAYGASSEPTVVTADPVATGTREYSGTQQPSV